MAGVPNPMTPTRKAMPKREQSAGSASLALLRAVVPERKAAPSAIYDPPYPRNGLGEKGIPAIELYKAVKASGENPVEVSKQLSTFQTLIETDTDVRNMILTPASSGRPRIPAVGAGSQFPFMQGRPAPARPDTSGKGPVSGLLATQAQRDAKFDALFAKLKFSKPVIAFLKQLTGQKGALLQLRRLQALFDELALYERNEVLVRLRTAEPLNKDQSKKLRAKITAAAAGQKLVFKEEVVPSLLGGLVVFYGNKKQDLSAAAKVREVQKLLSAQA